MSKDDVTRDNRQYLMRLKVEGQINMRVDPMTAKESYVNRIANQLHNQEKAGLSPNLEAARGHTKDDRYSLASTVAKAGGTFEKMGGIVIPFDENFAKNIEKIADKSPDIHIYVQLEDGTLAYGHGGIEAETLIDDMKEYDDYIDFYEFLVEMMMGDSPKKKHA